jgi:hypothetical protein
MVIERTIIIVIRIDDGNKAFSEWTNIRSVRCMASTDIQG